MSALQRELMQHAIAVLVGAMPSRFTIAPTRGFALATPEVTGRSPSELQQPRPGYRRRRAAHGRCKRSDWEPSRAAFLSQCHAERGGGLSGHRVQSPERAKPPVVRGSRRDAAAVRGRIAPRAELQRSWSQYAQTRDDYRATVLTAFQDVEDGMSLTQRLANEVGKQHETSGAGARGAVDLYPAVSGRTRQLSQCLGRASASTGCRARRGSAKRSSGSGICFPHPRDGWRMVGPTAAAGRQSYPIAPVPFKRHSETIIRVIDTRAASPSLSRSLIELGESS